MLLLCSLIISSSSSLLLAYGKIIGLAGKIASDGLDVKFLRPFSEKEFAFLPNSEKLLKAAETFREKGKITLKDSLEHDLSPSDLFGLIVFMEKRGIISIPYGTG
jgi:hypothetical protein